MKAGLRRRPVPTSRTSWSAAVTGGVVGRPPAGRGPQRHEERRQVLQRGPAVVRVRSGGGAAPSSSGRLVTLARELLEEAPLGLRQALLPFVVTRRVHTHFGDEEPDDLLHQDEAGRHVETIQV